jgi:L-ascorbate metabolism protein UlaG (beta-lactamase superfamily)
MATAPKKAEIRSFQVGFGDCFLLTFVYGENDKRHVLIDFGTTGLPRKAKPSVHMPKVANEIKQLVGDQGRLTAVVATHRHADHISGFGTTGATGGSGKIIRDLRPRLVLQPWTEDPDARADAKQATTASGTSKGFVGSLAIMNDIAGRVQRLADGNPTWMSAAVRKELSFLGADNIANRSAIDNLIAMGEQPGAKARYLRYGAKTGLESLLPGVKVHVLGPPDLTQTDSIRKMRSKDKDQFWHFVRGAVSLRAAAQAPGPGSKTKAKRQPVPIEGRWFRDRLQTLTGQSLLEIVRQLDDQMNNTSLILLFEFNGKKLLFPGDAQLENWSYALTEAKESASVRKMLAEVDFYKVGHHGSLNATPRKLLWEAFTKRKGRKLLTMMSTMKGKHGSTDKKTEVPRRTLADALRTQSRLKDTQTLKSSELEHMTVIP